MVYILIHCTVPFLGTHVLRPIRENIMKQVRSWKVKCSKCLDERMIYDDACRIYDGRFLIWICDKCNNSNYQPMRYESSILYPTASDALERSPELELYWRRCVERHKKGDRVPAGVKKLKFRKSERPEWISKYKTESIEKSKDYKLMMREVIEREKTITELYSPISDTEYDSDGVYVGPMDSQDIAYPVDE